MKKQNTSTLYIILMLVLNLAVILPSANGQQCTTFSFGGESCWYPMTVCVNTQGYVLLDVKKDYTYEFTTCMDILYEDYRIEQYDQQGNRIEVRQNRFPTQINLEEDLTANPILTEHRGPTCNGNNNATTVAWTASFTGKIRVRVQEYPNKIPSTSQGSDCVASFAYRVSAFPNTVKPNLIAWWQMDSALFRPKFITPPFYGRIDVGQNGKAEFIVLNVGKETTVTTGAGIYISKDDKLDASDALVKTVSIPPLGTGEFHSVSTTFYVGPRLISQNNQHGQIYILIKADLLDAVDESKENDNVIDASGLSLHQPGTYGVPDYVGSITMDLININKPKDMTLRMKIENKGTGDVEAMRTDYAVFYSRDAVLSSDDLSLEYEGFHSLAYYNVTALKINQSHSFYLKLWDWTRFALPNESGYFILSADHVNRITETPNEQNNFAVLPITFPSLNKPDLAPLHPYLPIAEGFRGEGFPIEFILKNVSEIEVPQPTLVSLYYSPDEQLDEEDLVIAEEFIDPLEPDMEVPIWMEAIVPEEAEPGPGFIILKVDSQDEIEESNEENNLFVYEFMVLEEGGAHERKAASPLISDYASLHIYPNPSNAIFHLEIGQTDKFETLEVHDIIGSLILSQSIAEDGRHTINLEALPAGIYVVKVRGRNALLSKKVLLSK